MEYLQSKGRFLAMLKKRNEKYISNVRVNAEIAWKMCTTINNTEAKSKLLNVLVMPNKITFEFAKMPYTDMCKIADMLSKRSLWVLPFELDSTSETCSVKYTRRDGKIINVKLRIVKETKWTVVSL